MKRCLIITGGKLDLSFAGSFLGQETFDKIIAVDAGLEAVKTLGLEPDMIVGDFDTVKPEVLAYYRRMEHIVWDTHQPEKDETDTELALLKAQATGCTEVVVLHGPYAGQYPSAFSLPAKGNGGIYPGQPEPYLSH